MNFIDENKTHINENRFTLARKYELGDGIDQNYYEAFEHYMQAFAGDYKKLEQWSDEQTNPIMLNYIAESYIWQIWHPRNLEKGIEIYEKLAKQGDFQAMFALSEIYSGKWDAAKTVIDFCRAFQLCKTVAESDSTHKEAQFNLAMMYLQGKGTVCDSQKGCELLSNLANQGHILANYFLGMMYRYGDIVEKDLKKAIKFLTNALSEENSFANGLNTLIYTELGEIYFHGEVENVNYKKAFEYWNKVPEEADLPKLLYYRGVCYLNGFGTDVDYTNPRVKKEYFLKAKKCFERAFENGYNCGYALEMVRRDLGELNQKGEMRKYGESLISQNLSGDALYKQIETDLKDDFGECWNLLKTNAKTALTTGMLSYIVFLAMGEKIYPDIDFTSVITPFAKSLEAELAEYFYKGYILYLKKSGISPYEFPQDTCFIESYNGKQIYSSLNSTWKFSLGAMPYVVGIKDCSYAKNAGFSALIDTPLHRDGHTTINKYMLAYADYLFKDDAFNERDRLTEIVNFLVDFSIDVKDIKNIRNPSAHGEIMSCSHAEQCGDYLIKVRKIIGSLLDKIDIEALTQLNSSDKIGSIVTMIDIETTPRGSLRGKILETGEKITISKKELFNTNKSAAELKANKLRVKVIAWDQGAQAYNATIL